MNALQIAVENIKCGGCANSIKSSLLKIDGVEAVQIDVEKGEVALSGAQLPAKETIITALDKMGYPESGNNTLFKSAKSFVSCAIGRITPEPA